MSTKKQLLLKIITPEHIVFDAPVDHVLLPSTSGEIDVLPGHVSLMTALDIGAIVIFKESEEIHMAMGGGYCEVKNDVITVLADTAERAEELDEDRALRARQRAQTLMEDREKASEKDQALVSSALQRSLTRLKVLERYRKRRKKNI